jgi:GTP-binding protein Era
VTANNPVTKAGYVALIGKPNAGKSTLMNSLVGEKLSIVTPKPQTTRKPVLGICTFDNTQIVFKDTPGILQPKYELQRSLMGYVEEAIEDSDVLAVIVEIIPKVTAEEYLPPDFIEALKNIKKPKVLIINKIDLLKNVKEVLPLMDKFNRLGIFDEIIPMSALRATSTDELLSVLAKYLPENPFYFDPEMLSTQSERFFVSEIIREHIFTASHEEVPYSSEVNITEFKEREAGKWYISAEIIIERSSQKAIIIGAGGSKIKEIGAKARTDIEEHLQMPVFLDLFVKVREKWRNDKTMLRSFGY